tara:strand:- start:2096 stop:2347 length:252 start_codon:yes stop_codon:yes gene_type:complete
MFDRLNKITREFILNEGAAPTFQTWFQALYENLASLKPRTLSDQRRVDVMKHQLNELRRTTRQMHHKITQLEEQLQLLQEEQL